MPASIENFFHQRDRFGNGRALYVIAAIAFLLPITLATLRGLKMDNNVERWLPEEDHAAQILAWHQQNFPQGEQLLVTWDGASLEDPRLAAFETALIGQTDDLGIRRGGSELIGDVVTPADVLQRMTAAHVDDVQARDRLQGTLLGAGPLRVTLADFATADSLGPTLAKLAEASIGRPVYIGPPASGSENHLDPEAESSEGSAADSTSQIPAHDLTLHWSYIDPSAEESAAVAELIGQQPGVKRAFFFGGSPVAVVVSLSEAGIAERPAVIAFVRQAASDVGIPAESLHLGGSPVASVALNKGAQTAAWNTAYPIWNLPFRSPFLTSGLIGAIIALIALRSVRLGILVLGVSYTTTLMAVACVPAAGDSMNMVLIVMPTLLTVLTLSGAIHVANYWKHEAHESPVGAVGRAVKQALAPCLLASATTAVGLLSLLNSTLTPVRQFGFYSAIGCAIALAMVLFGLPALLQLWRGPGGAVENSDEVRWIRFGDKLGRLWAPVAVLCIACGAIATAGLASFQTETKVIRYFPDRSDIVRDYQAIEGKLAGITPVDIVVRFDANAQETTDFLQRMEAVRAASAAVAADRDVTGTLSLADFQPATERPDAKASTFKKIRFRQRIRRVEEECKSGQGDAFLTVATEQVALDGQSHVLCEAGDELWRITAQAAAMTDSDYGRLIDGINERVQVELNTIEGASHVVTGMVPLFMRTQEAVLESLIRSFGLAFGIIALVLAVLLRSPIGGLIAMIPNLLPVGLVFGLISWAGQRVDIGTMITASVALGIAVDGTLHLLTWFRRGLDAGHNRMRAMSLALGHCGPAMWQTSAAVGLCLLALLPAELLLISRFGWLMAALVGAALVADVILLPALLAGPLGMILESKKRKAERRATAKRAPAINPRSRRTVPTGPHFDRADRTRTARKSA